MKTSVIQTYVWDAGKLVIANNASGHVIHRWRQLSTLEEKREEKKPHLWLQNCFFSPWVSQLLLPLLISLFCSLCFANFLLSTHRLTGWPTGRVTVIFMCAHGEPAASFLRRLRPELICLIMWFSEVTVVGGEESDCPLRLQTADGEIFWETHQAFKYIRIRSSSSSIGFCVCVWIFCTKSLGLHGTNLLFSHLIPFPRAAASNPEAPPPPSACSALLSNLQKRSDLHTLGSAQAFKSNLVWFFILLFFFLKGADPEGAKLSFFPAVNQLYFHFPGF